MLAVVKTVTRNISLHEDLADYALRKAEEECHGNVSSYFAELLRRERQAEIDADLRFLAKAMKGAPSDPPPMDQIVAACKRARRRLFKRAQRRQSPRKR